MTDTRTLSIVLAMARCGLSQEPPSTQFVHQIRRLANALSPAEAEKFKELLAWHDGGREKCTAEVVLSDAAPAPAAPNLQWAMRQIAQLDPHGNAGTAVFMAKQALATPAPTAPKPVIYEATLKTRKQIEAEIPREAQGWWADACPGETLELRDATEADIARCVINEGQSRDPKDYMCEPRERGALVLRAAIASIEKS